MNKTITALAVLVLAGGAFAQTGTKSTTPKPQMRVVEENTTTVYDVTTKNKRGTAQYGMVEETQTTPQGGTRVVSQMEYADYTPSKMALANEKRAEVSVGLGAAYSFNKDTQDMRMADMGLAATGQVLWDMSDHLSLGADYMLLTPDGRSSEGYSYDRLRLNSIALAGKYTINAWDTWRIYVPMGVGAAQARLKTSGQRGGADASESSDKWGLDLFAGLGLQYNLSADLFLALEYRYTVAFVKAEDLNKAYGKDNYLQFHSAFLRLGMRF